MKRKTDKFDGETYKTVYEKHVKHLTDLKARSANAYHSIMSEVYCKVVYVKLSLFSSIVKLIYIYSGNSINPKNADTIPGDALAVMDFSGFD